MKTLNTFINEKLNSFFEDEYMDAIITTIDYFYNEGIVDYDDDNLDAYAKGGKEPNYQEIVDEIIMSYKPASIHDGGRMADGPYKTLKKKYPSDKTFKKDFDELVIKSIKNYIELR